MRTASSRWTVVCEGLGFPEGPTFDSNGVLHVTEIANGRVSRIEHGRRTTFAEPGGGPNGAAWGPDGALYVANNGGLLFIDGYPKGKHPDNDGGRIERITPDGAVERLYVECDGEPLAAPNDLVFDAHGSFYFTDPLFGTRVERPPGHVYYASADGSNIRRVDTGFALSNGIGITDDGSTLIVCESISRRLLAMDIVGPGKLGSRRTLCRLPDEHMPDGFAFDADGNILCAGVNGGAVCVYDGAGGFLERIPTEDIDPTNCAFGGPDQRTLFLCEGRLGRVVALDWERPGMSLFPAR